jgi:hypothetical protein
MPKPDITAKIQQVASMAGIKGQRQGELLSYGWDFGHGRDQMVYVAPFAETDDGLNVICFFSPCQRLGTGFLSGMSKQVALQLLRTNSELEFGHFAVMKLGGEEMICVRATQILETMEVQEFEQKCLAVARLADAWEEKIGKNEF